jgi:hypothetical protein
VPAQDLDQPSSVQDVRWPGRPRVPHHLPAERDAFVGRTSDLQTLDRLLGDSRLVSVLGIGDARFVVTRG